MLKPWIHKTRPKKNKWQNNRKSNQRGRKKYIACSNMFFTFFWPMGLGETLANFFQRIFGVCSRFSRNKRLWTKLCHFFWWFPFYHFDILLAVLMNLDVIFCLGLEINPCESRLEFVHPKKIKNKQTNDTTEKATKEEEKSTLPAATCFLLFFGQWV